MLDAESVKDETTSTQCSQIIDIFLGQTVYGLGQLKCEKCFLHYQCTYPEDGGNILLRNIGNDL